MRITADVAMNAAEIERGLENTGLLIVRVAGTHVERIAGGSVMLAKAITQDARDDGRITPDAPRVSADEAVELMLHHLQLAAMYFEGTPDDHCEQVFQEAARITKLGSGAHVDRAIRMFVLELDSYYEGLKKS